MKLFAVAALSTTAISTASRHHTVLPQTPGWGKLSSTGFVSAGVEASSTTAGGGSRAPRGASRDTSAFVAHGWCSRSRLNKAVQMSTVETTETAVEVPKTAPGLTGLRSWREEFAQEQYHKSRSLHTRSAKMTRFNAGVLEAAADRDFERVLKRGVSKSPGSLPHFGKIVAETMEKTKKVLVESGGKGPVTLNVVVHEWLDNELTNHIVENAGAKNEVTVFVGNEFFVDLDVLKKGEHVLVPTGGTWKSVTPQTVACMATVILARALKEEAGLLPGGGGNQLSVQMFADTVAAEGVITSCLPAMKEVSGTEITLNRIHESWKDRLSADGKADAPLSKKLSSIAESYLKYEYTSEQKEDFANTMKSYRRELKSGGQPLLFDVLACGTTSERRNDRSYNYLKMDDGALLVAVATEPNSLEGVQERAGGLEAAQPDEVCIVEGAGGPNMATALMLIVATEAFLTKADNPVEIVSEVVVKEPVVEEPKVEPVVEAAVEIPAEYVKMGFAPKSISPPAPEPVKKVVPDMKPVVNAGSIPPVSDKAAVTVLVGLNGMLVDLVNIGDFNGVRMASLRDLPHDRIGVPPRGRKLPKENRLRTNNVGFTRTPLGRWS